MRESRTKCGRQAALHSRGSRGTIPWGGRFTLNTRAYIVCSIITYIYIHICIYSLIALNGIIYSWYALYIYVVEVFPLQTRSFAPDMVTAEAKGQVQRMGSQAMHGLERLLLEHVVANAEPQNPDSVIAAMDAFWNKTFQAQGGNKD